MKWQDWAPTMAAIRAEFGYDEAADRHAAYALLGHLTTDDWPRIDVADRSCVVVGCARSLDKVTQLPDGLVVACDGATAHLQELGIVPDLVVTDLDGETAALRWAAEENAVLVVHAHGDNLDALSFVRGRPFAGTFQVEPEPGLAPLQNLGGFTDGDRAVLLLEALGAKSARLVAFDSAEPPSRHSHRFGPEKAAKLAWADRIIAACQSRGRLEVTSVAQRT